MERHIEDHHYQLHRHHLSNRPDQQQQQPPPPNYYQHHHQQYYINRQDHFVDHNNDRKFNNLNPDSYFDFDNNHQMSSELDESFVGVSGGGFCSGGRKRGRFFPDHTADAVNAKLYVAPVPNTTTEENTEDGASPKRQRLSNLEILYLPIFDSFLIRPLFEEHGRVVEVVFPRDKRSGQQQGYCFIKYAMVEEANGAIRALNGQFTFPGEACPIKVRYADGERERLGIVERERLGKGEREHIGGGEFVDKLYVGSINKQASKQEIEEIFSPYGNVEDVYIARDVLKQSRGCAFIKFSHRDMAVAAIKALNGVFTMRGCDQPLVVRFADPKRRRNGGELRGSNAFGGQTFGPCSQEPMIRPASSFGDGMGGCVFSNPSYPMQEVSIYSQPQTVSHTIKLALGTSPIIEQSIPSVKLPPAQVCQMSPQQTQAPQNCLQSSSQQAVSEMRKQTQNLEQQHSAQIPLESAFTGSNPPEVTVTSAAPPVPPSPKTTDPQGCDWSEHNCPDGYKYYYNCMTCESRWEKPAELTSFQQQFQKQQKVHNPSQQPDSLSTGFCGEEIDRIQMDLDQVQIHSETSPVVDPTCV